MNLHNYPFFFYIISSFLTRSPTRAPSSRPASCCVCRCRVHTSATCTTRSRASPRSPCHSGRSSRPHSWPWAPRSSSLSPPSLRRPPPPPASPPAAVSRVSRVRRSSSARTPPSCTASSSSASCRCSRSLQPSSLLSSWCSSVRLLILSCRVALCQHSA